MEIITSRDEGMFPAPREIEMDCSCPDGARMCKHIAAVLYGIGARFDDSPELLFTLRGVDHLELLAQAADVTKIGAGSTQVEAEDACRWGFVGCVWDRARRHRGWGETTGRGFESEAEKERRTPRQNGKRDEGQATGKDPRRACKETVGADLCALYVRPLHSDRKGGH